MTRWSYSMPQRLRVALLSVLMALSGVALAAEEGSVCVGPLPMPGEQEFGQAMTSDEFAVSVDGRPAVKASSTEARLISGIPLSGRHAVVIYRAEKRSESFYFRFSDYDSDRLCLWYKFVYETWSLREMSGSRHLCGCAQTE